VGWEAVFCCAFDRFVCGNYAFFALVFESRRLFYEFVWFELHRVWFRLLVGVSFFV